MCLLNFYTTWILTSMFCVIECTSRLIKVTDCNNAQWKLEIGIVGSTNYGIVQERSIKRDTQYSLNVHD